MKKEKIYYNSPDFLKDLIGWGFRRFPRLRWAPIEKEINYFSEFKKNEFVSSEVLKELQNKKLRKLINYVTINVPYYRDLFSKLNIDSEDIRTTDDLYKIPILTKEIIRSNPQEFISDEYKENLLKLTKVSTGGSTGTPMEYLFDDKMVGVRRATWWRWSEFAGVDLYKDRMIYVGGAPKKWVFQPENYRGLVTYDRRRLVLSSAAMSDNVLDRYIEDVLKFKGDYIRGYASGVYLLARKVLDNKLVIPMKAVLTSSDTLYPQYRKVIEEAFRCKVYDHYGQNEDILTATECRFESGLHINVESVFAETINEKDEVVFGEEGRFVSTHLENYAMPLIRYVVGDTGILDTNWTKCSCGRSHQKILKFTGRNDEIIITSKGRRIGSGSLNQPMKEMLGKIVKCQYIQESYSLVRVKVVPTEKWNSLSDEKELLNNIKNQIGDDIQVNIELVNDIKQRSNGKYQFIKSKLK